MKKVIFILFCALLFISCVEKFEYPDTTEIEKNVKRLQTTEEYYVPIRSGFVTKVVIDEDTVAEAVTPMSILLPKQSSPKLVYISKDEYPNEIIPENSAKLYQVICFEDSKAGDYDYNDFVFHVLYKTEGNIFGFGVQPVALGSTKPIQLGCAVYKGETIVFKGLITPEDNDCRTQYFKSQEGFINTIGTKVNSEEYKKGYLGSTIRNWNIDKIPGDGAMRVEWYIKVDDDKKELYALSTKYLNQSFDKNNFPYGLVITGTGSEYTDNGIICGKDWFNYPQEGQSIENVYPEIWEWLTTDKSFQFKDIYNKDNVPANAYPASDFGLYKTSDVNVCQPQYCQN